MAAAITRDAFLALGVGWDRQWHLIHFFATTTLAHVALRESVP